MHDGTLSGWHHRALLEEVLVPPRRAFVPLPGMRVIERPGWQQLITPWFRDGGFNGVSWSVLEESQADTVIDATIAEYRRIGVRFRWNVAPGSAPADLGARLGLRGLGHRVSVGMARLTHDLLPCEAGAIEVTEVGLDRVDEFSRISARGWGCPTEPLVLANRMSLEHPEGGLHLFLASFEGEPAATGAYFAFARSAYLMGGVVLPEQRRRGLYRALVDARLRHAAGRGISLATSHALEQTSAPLLARLGFVSVCRFDVYQG